MNKIVNLKARVAYLEGQVSGMIEMIKIRLEKLETQEPKDEMDFMDECRRVDEGVTREKECPHLTWKWSNSAQKKRLFFQNGEHEHAICEGWRCCPICGTSIVPTVYRFENGKCLCGEIAGEGHICQDWDKIKNEWVDREDK